VKLKHLFGGLLRFRTQDAIKILDPEKIVDEIYKISQPKDYTYHIAPKIKKPERHMIHKLEEKKRTAPIKNNHFSSNNNKIILDIHD